MNLYLIRHADAKSEQEDILRPLSENGLQEIKKVADHLSLLNLSIDQIFHSTKLRAKQTADVLSEKMKPAKGISEAKDLSPQDDPRIWAERLNEVFDNIMLVGHLPHLEMLTSLLLSGDMDKDIVSFPTAGIACLERDDEGIWSLQWMITSEIIV